MNMTKYDLEFYINTMAHDLLLLADRAMDEAGSKPHPQWECDRVSEWTKLMAESTTLRTISEMLEKRMLFSQE